LLKEKAQADMVTYANISIPVPKFPFYESDLIALTQFFTLANLRAA